MSIKDKDIIIDTDVLVIGGGMAGVFAAIKAKEAGANVTLVEKGYMSRAGASAANDGHMTVYNPDWGHKLDTWLSEHADRGEYMNNPEWTNTSCKESYDRFQDVVSYGVKIPKTPEGELVHPFRPLGHHSQEGIDAIWLGWGFETMPVLRKHVLKIGVKIVDRVSITDLITQDGCVTGAVGFHTRTGDFYVFNAKATVISTGTSGFKGQAPGCFNKASFDGEAIAYRAGAKVSGMEFAVMGRVSPYVGNWPDDKQTQLEGRKINDVYYRYAPFLEGQPMPLNLMGNYVDSEGHGRGPFHPYVLMTIHEGKGPLLLDTASCTQEEINHACLLYTPPYERFAQVGADPVGRDLYSGVFSLPELFTGRHMGGSGGVTATGIDGGTTLPGLYGAGDSYHSAICGSVYASGGTGLRVAATTGARAGQSAAKFASQRNDAGANGETIAKLRNATMGPLERTGGFDPIWAGDQVRNLMMPYYVWGVRHEERLKATISFLDFLGGHIAPLMKARDPHQLAQAHEAKNRIIGARMMMESALFRKESRGVCTTGRTIRAATTKTGSAMSRSGNRNGEDDAGEGCRSINGGPISRPGHTLKNIQTDTVASSSHPCARFTQGNAGSIEPVNINHSGGKNEKIHSIVPG